ncbi:MAG: hypothetical protein AAB519_03570 [Patescibacteria group bacterium]
METQPAEEKKTNKKSAVIKWVLVIGIAIVINLFLAYLVQALYERPEYQNFCEEKQVNRAIENETACVEVGGQWNENINMGVPVDKMSVPEKQAYCDVTFTCSKAFEKANEVYNRNVFIVFVVAGFLLLLGSVFLVGSEAVSLGLSFGGVIALIVGSISYWSDMNDILRVIILGIALVALLGVAWKKFHD